MSRTSPEATLSELEDQLVKGGAAVIATDLDGVITHWSAAAERLYGWSGEEAIGLPILEFMVTLDDRQLAEVRCKDGSLMLAHVRDALMKDDAGRRVGILGLSMDASLEPKAPLERGFRAVGGGLSPPSSADSGGGIRTRDLRVMSPTSYLTAPPRGVNTILASASGHQVPANRSRSVFLENLPTEVLGTSSMNSTRSGIHQLATRTRGSGAAPRRRARALLGHDAGERALAPALVGHTDDRRLADGRVGHDLVLELDRGDPLAARLDEVLRAVDEVDVALAGRSSQRPRCAASRPRRTAPGCGRRGSSRPPPTGRRPAARRAPRRPTAARRRRPGSTIRHSTSGVMRPCVARRSASSSSEQVQRACS